MGEQLLESEMEGLEDRVIVEERTLLGGKPVTDEMKQLLKEIGEELLIYISFKERWLGLDYPENLHMMEFEEKHPKKLKAVYSSCPLNVEPDLKYSSEHGPWPNLKGIAAIYPFDLNDQIEEIVFNKPDIFNFLIKTDFLAISRDTSAFLYVGERPSYPEISFGYREVYLTLFYKNMDNKLYAFEKNNKKSIALH